MWSDITEKRFLSFAYNLMRLKHQLSAHFQAKIKIIFMYPLLTLYLKIALCWPSVILFACCSKNNIQGNYSQRISMFFFNLLVFHTSTLYLVSALLSAGSSGPAYVDRLKTFFFSYHDNTQLLFTDKLVASQNIWKMKRNLHPN